jgi:hypothetical protein
MNRNKTPPSHRLATDLLAGTLLSLSLLGSAQAEDTIGAIPNATDAYATDRLAPSSSDLANLLPLVLTSHERRKLAENLEASIRNGDMNGAQNDLNAAIEVGTLAIVLSGQLKNPDLLATLQSLGIKGDAAATSEPVNTAANCTMPTALTDLQEAIDREKNYSSMISQTLNDLMQENNALKARLDTDKAAQDATVSDLQQALQKEQAKSETANHELAGLRSDYQTLQSVSEQTKAASVSATEWEARLRDERQQRDAAALKLADVEKELRDLKVLKEQESISQSAHVSELEKTLARTQAQGEVLAQELVAVNKELSTLKESYQSSATPLMHRIEKAGMDTALPPAVESAPRETSALAQSDAAPSPPADMLPTQGNANLQPQKEPAPVVIASLPTSLNSIPATSPPADQPKPDDRLTSRADELLRKGDVSGARLLLERALDNRNARAAFLMGETFDPNVLTKLRVLGIRGDATKAREFYAQALALGMTEARMRMEALK